MSQLVVTTEEVSWNDVEREFVDQIKALQTQDRANFDTAKMWADGRKMPICTLPARQKEPWYRAEVDKVDENPLRGLLELTLLASVKRRNVCVAATIHKGTLYVATNHDTSEARKNENPLRNYFESFESMKKIYNNVTEATRSFLAGDSVKFLFLDSTTCPTAPARITSPI